MAEKESQVEAGTATPGHDTKFTPGPWKATKPSQVWQVNTGQTSHYGVALVVERRERGSSLYDSAETAANAHLIAAAPELYAALVRVLPMVRACEHEDFSDLDGNEDTRTDALRNAIAVLAKARGSAVGGVLG